MNSPFPKSPLDGGAASTRVDQAGSALHDSIEKVAEPARSAVERASASAHDAVDRITGKATRLANGLDEKTRLLTDAPRKAIDYSKTTVQDYPLHTVAASLLVGFLIGRLTASRNTPRREY